MRRAISSTSCGVSKLLWNSATDCLERLIAAIKDLQQFTLAIPQRTCRHTSDGLIGEAD